MSGPEKTRGTSSDLTGDAVGPSGTSPATRSREDRDTPHGPGFARPRRRTLGLALAGAGAAAATIAPGVNAAPGAAPRPEPTVQVRTGWLLRPDDR